MSASYRLKRSLTDKERVFAGTESLVAGSIVYRCIEPTYGCIGPWGTAMTNDPDGGYPFFEIPTNALEPVS